MSQWDKLMARLKNLSTDMRIEELAKILERCGYVQSRGKGSHVLFRKQGSRPVVIPDHRPLKVQYIRMVRDIVENEGM